MYLYSDGADADSFVYKLTSPLTEIFVGFDVHLCDSTLAYLAAHPGVHTPSFFQLFDLYGQAGLTPTVAPADFTTLGDYDGLHLETVAGLQKWTEEAAAVDLETAVSGATSIAYHLDLATDTYVITINGNVHDLSGNGYFSGWMTQIDALIFGAGTGSFGWGPGSATNLTNITAGTTAPGSSDIAADDFSGGDFTAWDGTVGRCYILDTPRCTSGYLNPTLVFDGDAVARTV